MAPDRRSLFIGAMTVAAWPAFAATPGQSLVAAARRQVGVTTGYDPAYLRLAYPGGDPPRSTGVCTDVIIRAARDGLNLDLQRLVHEDMTKFFTAYPSRRAWGLSRPDSNIDHRRVPNLETYWTRAGARLWKATRFRVGDGFELPLRSGDLLTWLVVGGRPHVGVVGEAGSRTTIVHNIGGGVEEVGLWTLLPHRAVAHYRWPLA